MVVMMAIASGRNARAAELVAGGRTVAKNTEIDVLRGCHARPWSANAKDGGVGAKRALHHADSTEQARCRPIGRWWVRDRPCRRIFTRTAGEIGHLLEG